MTVLGGHARKTGIEVREVRGIGWSIVTTWDGEILDRARLFRCRDVANEFARGLHDDVREGIEAEHGWPPYLDLAEAPDAKA